MGARVFSPVEIVWLAENVRGHGCRQLTEMFNRHFGRQVTVQQIKAACHNRGLSSGLTGHFPSGHRPWNTGVKHSTGWSATRFQPGRMPPTYRPVGSERVDNKDGYLWVKIADPKTWRPKHLVIWEQAHGPVPKGHVVIFADGNRRNLDLDNLVIVTRAELAQLNKNGLIAKDAELTRVGVGLTKLRLKVAERKKSGKGSMRK